MLPAADRPDDEHTRRTYRTDEHTQLQKYLTGTIYLVDQIDIKATNYTQTTG